MKRYKLGFSSSALPQGSRAGHLPPPQLRLSCGILANLVSYESMKYIQITYGSHKHIQMMDMGCAPLQFDIFFHFFVLMYWPRIENILSTRLKARNAEISSASIGHYPSKGPAFCTPLKVPPDPDLAPILVVLASPLLYQVESAWQSL